ncbi:MAG: YeeE/YedE family protein [Ruminococcaceae bacterium]|nr:YeeE/YedE family protein [Oscillospiraceae bacterium]
MKTHKIELIIAAILLLLVLVIGATLLPSSLHFARLLIGVGIGYALSRGAYGFAGTANRAINTGSTKLMRSFMLLIILSSFVTVVFAAVPAADVNSEFVLTYAHFIHPVSLGTIIGSFMFGIGMAFAGGCASGVLTDLTVEFPKALIALFFFGMGFVISMPFGKMMPIMTTSFIKSSENVSGVWFPDLFKFDGLNGFLGALIVNIILAAIVIKLSYVYEAKRKAKGTYTGVESEKESEEAVSQLLDTDLPFYQRFFARPWTLWETAVAMALMYVALMGFTKSAWGVSGAFGFWFAKFLNLVGVSAETIGNYTGNPEFVAPGIFQHQQSVQDMGIVLGAFIGLLSMGKLFKSFKDGLKITVKQSIFAVLGGLLMGLSIGFSRGCNAGGLFSPIVSFSLSGWLFLTFMVCGAIVGNFILNPKKNKKE